MFWGKRPNDHTVAPAGAISGHVDDWEDLAVDFVDGTLDAETARSVEQHLAGCPECAARLQRQQSVLTLLHETPLFDAPAEIENQVVDEVLWPREARRARIYTVSRSAAWRRAGTWIPATVIVVAVLVGVVGFAVLRSGAGLDEAMNATTVAAAGTTYAADTTSAGAPTLESAGAGDASTPTTAPMIASVPSTGAPTGTTTRTSSEEDGTSAKAFGPAVQDRGEMITGASSATDMPAYFLFESVPAAPPEDEQPGDTPQTTIPSPITGDGDTLLTAEQAQAVASQITALTGLEPLDDSLAFGNPAFAAYLPTFAAYLPRNDTDEFVDLLRSIGSSLGLTVSWTPEPGQAVWDWTPVLLEGKTGLAELSATRTPSPAVSSWTFTTSTLAPPADPAGEPAPVVTPDDEGTHVLVVILLNVLP